MKSPFFILFSIGGYLILLPLIVFGFLYKAIQSQGLIREKFILLFSGFSLFYCIGAIYPVSETGENFVIHRTTARYGSKKIN